MGMTPISITGSGLLVLIVEALLHTFGITPDAGSVAAVVNAAIIALGWITLIVGQLTRKDLHFGLIRKTSV